MDTKCGVERKSYDDNTASGSSKNDRKLPKLSIEEYITLRDETNERIQIMNNQGANAFGIVLTAWAAGFGMLGVLLANISKIPPYLIKYIFTLQIIAFLASLLMLLPMSVKSGENLRQIISLGTYIRVFYNYLPQHGKVQEPLLFWDTADKRINYFATSKGLRKTDNHLASWYNHEYIILGLASFIFMLISLMMLFDHLLSTGQVSKKWILGFIGIVLLFLALFVVYQIYKSSCAKLNLMGVTEEYMKKYILVAYEFGFIEKEELKKAWNELNPDRDVEVVDDLFVMKRNKKRV